MIQEKDMIELGKRDHQRIFLKRQADIAQTFVEAHKPYCSKCAIEEYELEVTKLKAELKLKTGRDTSNYDADLIELAKNFKLEKYGDLTSFNKVGERQRVESKLVGTNSHVNIVIIETAYECKKYGHGCTVSVNKDELINKI